MFSRFALNVQLLPYKFRPSFLDTKKFIKGAYDLYKNLDPTTLIKGAMKACKKNFFGFACDI